MITTSILVVGSDVLSRHSQKPFELFSAPKGLTKRHRFFLSIDVITFMAKSFSENATN